jgi:flagellar biosynthesis protein FlhG
MNGKKDTLVVSFVSGKGLIGKSTILSLVARILSEKFSSILIWDNDIYTPIQHIVNGVEPNVSLLDVVIQNIATEKALIKINNKLFLVGGVNSFQIDIDLSDILLNRFQNLLEDNDFDLVLVDNHSGFSKLVANFCKVSTVNLLFLTDEPTSIVDGYGLTKILYKFFDVKNIATIVNNVIEKEDGINIANIFNQATLNFLGIKFPNFSIIPYEKDLKKYFFSLYEFLQKNSSQEFRNSINELSEKIQKMSSEKIFS